MAGSYEMLAAWAAVVGVVHAIIYASFSTAARQARKAARVHDLPDWLPAQVGRQAATMRKHARAVPDRWARPDLEITSALVEAVGEQRQVRIG